MAMSTPDARHWWQSTQVDDCPNWPIPTPDGMMTPEQVASAVQTGDVVHTPTGLVALENTHNMAGGRVMSLE